MKRLTYDQVMQKAESIFMDFTAAELIEKGDFDLEIMVRALIESINESISWEGSTVICKTDLDLSIYNARARCSFLVGTEFKVVTDKDCKLIIEHKNGTVYEVPRKWVYLK